MSQMALTLRPSDRAVALDGRLDDVDLAAAVHGGLVVLGAGLLAT